MRSGLKLHASTYLLSVHSLFQLKNSNNISYKAISTARLVRALTIIIVYFLYSFGPFRTGPGPSVQQQANPHRLHKHATSRTRTRVRFQHVPLAPAQNRDRHLLESVGETGENLVPEPASQVQEGDEGPVT